MSLPITLPSVSPRLARSRRHIFRRREPLALDTASGALSVTLDPAARPRAPALLRLRADGSVFGVEVESACLDILFEKRAGRSVDEAFRDDRTLRAEIALCELLDGLEAACGDRIELLEVAETPCEGALDLAGWLNLDDGWAFRVKLPNDLVDRACSLLASWPTAPRPLALPVSCPLVLAGSYVGSELLAQTGPGDFIPLRGWRHDGNVFYLRVPDGRCLPARAESAQLTILDATGDFAMPESREADDVTLTPDTQEKPSARLLVEMGEVQIPLGELELVVPGYVIDLQLPPDGPITVTANGQPFATGTLVEVAGTIGVQISELLGDA